MSGYLTTIEIQKESMQFTAGHTTIFSATEREPLHGHRYQVYLALTTRIEDNGMTFDYRYYKTLMRDLCRHLNQRFLMPKFSPFLQFAEDRDYYYFTFNHKKIPFLKEDVLIMPLTNITIEELSRWFVGELTKDQEALLNHRIQAITVKVFSAPGQSASHHWQA